MCGMVSTISQRWWWRDEARGLRVKGLGFGVWGLGFWVWGLGCEVWGLGFGVGSMTPSRLQSLLIDSSKNHLQVVSQAAVERMWHTQDSQSQILALAFR
jgi:hypothetical protein